MAEREQSAQIAMVQIEQADERIATSRGQWLAFLLPVTFVLGALLSVYMGAHPTVSAILAGVPVVGAISAIVQGRKKSGTD